MEENNMKAMRDALKHVEKLAREFAAGNYYISDFPKMLLDAIRPALSAPPRNCDVGTVKDQTQRFYRFCKSRSGAAIGGECDPNCPCYDCDDVCQC